MLVSTKVAYEVSSYMCKLHLLFIRISLPKWLPSKIRADWESLTFIRTSPTGEWMIYEYYCLHSQLLCWHKILFRKFLFVCSCISVVPSQSCWVCWKRWVEQKSTCKSTNIWPFWETLEYQISNIYFYQFYLIFLNINVIVKKLLHHQKPIRPYHHHMCIIRM